MRLHYALLIVALIGTYLNSGLAQQAIVRRPANLRVDPSTNEPPEAKLRQGDILTLLDPTRAWLLPSKNC